MTNIAMRYRAPARILHALVFVLVALALFAIEIRGPHGSDSRALWTGVHRWAGVLVLLSMIVRLAYRLIRGAPPSLAHNIFEVAARLLHALFYVLLLAMPLLGILMDNTGGHPVTLAGLDLSITLVGANESWHVLLKGAHEFIGNALFYLIGLHILAALWHHIVLRDGTLRRMF